jgi:glycosyltransferase involved in cell wall biosynthesis
MKTPLISVIMPCFNAQSFITSSIDCVFQQTYPSVELIIVDDGSTDHSLAIIQEAIHQYPLLKVLEQTNQGPYPARNLALTEASGDLIAFLDADDYWAPDCLEKLYGALVSNNADLSYCGWQNIVEKGENGPPHVPPAYETGDIHHAFLTGCPWPIHAALVKRAIVDKVNGFSTRCFTAMDYDFWIRISAVTQNIRLVPEVLSFYRWHQQGQISSIKWRQVLDAFRVRKDFIAQNPECVAHIPANEIAKLTKGYLMDQAYTAFWKRDLISAQKLFRACWNLGFNNFQDIKYILLSFLPSPIFQKMVHLSDQK